jgi:hypothetical protein
MTRTRELLSSTNSPHTRTVLPLRTTGRKITRPDTNIPDKHWNMPISFPVVAGSSSQVREVNGEAIKVLISGKGGNLVLTQRAVPESWAVK